MSFCLDVLNRLEAKLESISRSKDWTQEGEGAVYDEALFAVLKEDQGRTWAEGNIRIGDHILIIDSDTRLPKDCLLDAMSEMEQSPDVAIIQFRSGVMNVTDSFFLKKGGRSIIFKLQNMALIHSNIMTCFMDIIYSAITWAVAGGDAPPFVGHNAISRWSAIQAAAAYYDSENGYEKYWSEDHVLEDFAMTLHMQTAGYVIRYASYTGLMGSKKAYPYLSAYDKLAHWEMYAYDVNEVIFQPFRKWITRGPFTPLFRSFVSNKNIPATHKLTICAAYLGTYYAIASAFSSPS